MSETWEPYAIVNTPAGVDESAPLLVLLHGYGADERDLLPIAERLPQAFTVASIRAPLSLGAGYAWFPLPSEEDAPDFRRFVSTVERLCAWLEEEGPKHEKVVLLGFSQGMAMATSVLRHRPDLVDAVVGCSGFAVDSSLDTTGEFFDDEEPRSLRRPLFWGRDPEDPMIGAEMVEYTNVWARAATKLTKVNYAGIGHSIGEQEVSHIAEFLDIEVLGAQV